MQTKFILPCFRYIKPVIFDSIGCSIINYNNCMAYLPNIQWNHLFHLHCLHKMTWPVTSQFRWPSLNKLHPCLSHHDLVVNIMTVNKQLVRFYYPHWPINKPNLVTAILTTVNSTNQHRSIKSIDILSQIIMYKHFLCTSNNSTSHYVNVRRNTVSD